jgi:hypothetical protein
VRARYWAVVEASVLDAWLSFTTASVDAAGALSSAGRKISEVVEIAVSAFTSAVGAEEAGASCRPSIAGALAVFFFSQP